VKLHAATAALLVVVAIGFAVPAIAGKAVKPYLNAEVATAASTQGSSATSSVRLFGCGYKKLTTLQLWHENAGPYQEVAPDENGCVSATFTTWGVGDYVGWAKEQQGQSWSLSAETSLSVS
jgi:hypothetical protein